MVRKGHLRLVYSKKDNKTEVKNKNKIKELIIYITCLKYIFIPRRKKIQELRNIIANMYHDFELSSGCSDVPYQIRTEIKINKIINDNKINYYYAKLRKFQKFMKKL